MREIKSLKLRRSALLAMTGLVVSLVRSKLQYGYFWASWGSFAASWLAHSIAVILCAVLTVYCIKKAESFFIEKAFQGIDSADKRMIAPVVTILVACTMILFVHYWPALGISIHEDISRDERAF